MTLPHDCPRCYEHYEKYADRLMRAFNASSRVDGRRVFQVSDDYFAAYHRTHLKGT